MSIILGREAIKLLCTLYLLVQTTQQLPLQEQILSLLQNRMTNILVAAIELQCPTLIKGVCGSQFV